MNYTFVAIHLEYEIPIGASDSIAGLFDLVDEHMGPSSKRLSWQPYTGNFPDDYEGKIQYRITQLDGSEELEHIKVYCIQYKQTEK